MQEVVKCLVMGGGLFIFITKIFCLIILILYVLFLLIIIFKIQQVHVAITKESFFHSNDKDDLKVFVIFRVNPQDAYFYEDARKRKYLNEHANKQDLIMSNG